MKSYKIMKSLVALFALALVFAFVPDIIYGISGFVLAAPILLASIETSDDAKAKRSEIYNKMNAMLELRKSEKRSFTTEEDGKYNELKTDFDNLTKQIEELQADEKRALIMAGAAARKQAGAENSKDLNKYSLKRAIDLQLNGRVLDGIEGEMHQEAEKEARGNGLSLMGVGIPSMALDVILKRGQSATGQTSNALDQGGMMIKTEKEGLLWALRPLLVLSKLGVQMRGGLVGNIDLVKGTSLATAWESEVAEANETLSTTSKITLSPKRLAAFTAISKQLMIQSEYNFEQAVMGELLKAIAQAVESAAISGATSGSNPVGILATTGIGSVAIGATGGAPTWKHITDLEKEVAIDSALMGSLGYLTNHKVKSKLQNVEVVAASGRLIMEPGSKELNGYPVQFSNLVPSTLEKSSSGAVLSAAIFGDFSQMIIGQWGGLDMVVDPYTLAKTGQIQITTNSFWDVAIKYPEAFAAILDIATT